MTTRRDCAVLALLALVAPSPALLLHPAGPAHHVASPASALRPAMCSPLDGQQQRSGVVPMALARWRRSLKRAGAVLAFGAAGVFVQAPVSPAFASGEVSSTRPAVTRKKKNGQGTLATLALGGGMCYWSARMAQKEDEEEQVRIREETEKMDSMAKEFTDIDSGVAVDDDLMSSLRKRVQTSNATATSGEGGAGVGDPDSGDEGGPSGGDGPSEPPPPAPAPGGSSAVLDAPETPPPSEPPIDGNTPGATEQDIDMLKRMFGSSPEGDGGGD